MSRFKFVCGCGKRMAAYDWMVGQIITCPKCGQTMTVPTPFSAEEHLAEMIEKGYTPQRRKFGIPMERKSPAKKIVIVALIVIGVAAAAVAIWLLLSKNAS